MLKEFIKKYRLYIFILLALLIIISQIILTLLEKHDIAIIMENVKEAETETEKQKKKLGELIKQGKVYKNENRELRKKLENLKDNECYKYFIDYSLFLDEYYEYNNTFYLSNIAFYESLTNYKSELNKFRDTVEADLYRWSITPYMLTDFKKLGLGIDLTVPLTQNYSIVGGIGYFNEIYFKLGVGIKL